MGSKSKKTPSNKERNELARVKRENILLKAKLEQANKMIEIQKKMGEFVQGWEKENTDENPSK